MNKMGFCFLYRSNNWLGYIGKMPTPSKWLARIIYKPIKIEFIEIQRAENVPVAHMAVLPLCVFGVFDHISLPQTSYASH